MKQVITFYSYKGGVGRTFFLANTAALLARWGHRVLCVDFDLEAPGLRNYFELANPPRGLTDLILQVGAGKSPDWRSAVRPVTRLNLKGRLDLLDAGREGEAYANQLHDLNWNALYAESNLGGALERWRAEWLEEYDFVLIDSRTGLTDIGGICTAQLPDTLVTLFTCNDQSIDGTLRAVEWAERMRARLPYDRLALQVVPVTSRYDALDYPGQGDFWMGRVAQKMERLYREWSPERIEARRLAEMLRINYFSRWSFGEEVPAATERHTDDATITHEVARVAALLSGAIGDVERWVQNPTGYVETVALAKTRESGSFVAHDFEFDVFISRPADSPAAHALMRALTALGLNCYMPAPGGIDAVTSAVRRCRHLVWLYAPGALHQTSILVFAQEAMDQPERMTVQVTDARFRTPVISAGPTRVVRFTDEQQAAPEIAAYLRPASSHVSFSTPTPPDDPNPYQTWIKERHDKVVPFFAAAGQLRLAQIYVQLDVSQSFRGDKPERLDGLHIGQTTLLTLLERDDLPHQRWAILGEPGAGKTTLLRHLCRSLAANPDGPVPVFLSLAKHAADRPDPIEAALSEYKGPQLDAVRATLQAAQDAERIWLFLDGLDEVAPELQEQTRKWLDSLNASRIVVAGRPVSLSQGGIGRDWQSLRVQALNPTQQAELLKNLLGESEGELVWAELAQRPRMRDMARNPLLLTMVAMVGREAGAMGGALPMHRGQLYAAVIDLLLRRGHCPEPRSVRDRRAARTILQRLSLALHKGGGEAWTQDELSAVLKQLRRSEHEIDQLLKETWDGSNEQFLDDVGFNSGVLGPHDGPDEPWRYLHRSQREYLTAEALAEDEAATQAALADLQVKDRRERQRNANRWGETLVLACNLAAEPLLALTALRKANGELALRAVGDVPSLDPDAALTFLFETRDWSGEHLLTLARQWAVLDGGDAAIGRLWPLLAGSQPDYQSARIWYALVQMGDPDIKRLRAALRVGALPEFDWVAVEGGTFQMGSPDSVGHENERPQHAVTLDAFEMTRTTVSSAVFNKVFPSRLKSGGMTQPATRVSWYEAHLFATLVGARLPTEAEWEYACRAGTTTPWSHGEGEDELGKYAWYDANSGTEVHPVGEKAANPWGLYDMHGNVWEWCADWRADYPADPQTNPSGPPGGGWRVLRGGTYWSDADGCRSASRYALLPSSRVDYFGFRLARRPQLLGREHS